jgi:hypothetical protein
LGHVDPPKLLSRLVLNLEDSELVHDRTLARPRLRKLSWENARGTDSAVITTLIDVASPRYQSQRGESVYEESPIVGQGYSARTVE